MSNILSKTGQGPTNFKDVKTQTCVVRHEVRPYWRLASVLNGARQVMHFRKLVVKCGHDHL